MKILVTGADGFVGKNLVCALKNLKEGKDKTRPGLDIEEVFCYDVRSGADKLKEYCARADLVFNFAGVNRPKDAGEFSGNSGFAEELLSTLAAAGNRCPVMLASSVQACLEGRFAGSEYGMSKLKAEELFFGYGKKYSIQVYVFRFPNIFGKWCRPDYNSAVATFCHNIANGLPIKVNDPATELELLYIDDLVSAMLDLAEGKVERCAYGGATPVPGESGEYCFVPLTYRVTLGKIADLLYSFAAQPQTLALPALPDGSFEKKLYSTYLSYLPAGKIKFPLAAREDVRGSFTELLKTPSCGQFSLNVSNPGATKGEHWHNSKWELFIVVSGRALILERKIGTDEVLEFEVCGEKPEAVHMLPGYTHNIINLSRTEKLITLMWANEIFDPARPDTFYEKVEQDGKSN